MTKQIFLLIIAAMSFHSSAQQVSTSCFEIGGSGDEYLNSVIVTYDGNYVMAGRTFSWTNGPSGSPYVVKCNASGDTLWTLSLGAGAYASAQKIIEAADHSLVIVGSSNSQILIAKITADGIPLWSKNIDLFDLNQGFKITETTDGGYLISAEVEAFNGPRYSELIKVNVDGGIVWNRNYSSGFDTYPFALTETSDHHYIAAGQSVSFSDHTFIFCVDSDGSLLWGKENTDGGVWYDATTTPDNNVVIVGNHVPNRGASVMKLNNDGDSIWSHAFGGSLYCAFRSVDVADDGGYIMAGQATDFIDTFYGYVVKCDIDGQFQWGKVFPKTAFYSVVSTSDGGYVACSERDGDLYFVKLDADGNSCPDCASFSYGTQRQGTGINDLTFTAYNHAASDSSLALDKLSGGLTHILCSEVGIEETVKDNRQLTIFPEPADQFAVVSFQLPVDEQSELKVLDLSGKEIFQSEIDNSKFEINTSLYRNGIYFCEIKSGEAIAVSKFLVQHKN